MRVYTGMTQGNGRAECFWRQFMKNYSKEMFYKIFNKSSQVLGCLVLFSCITTSSYAQRFGGPVAVQAPGRAEAPIDLTGTWVSLVTEDWAYRMVTPAIGDTM